MNVQIYCVFTESSKELDDLRGAFSRSLECLKDIEDSKFSSRNNSVLLLSLLGEKVTRCGV